MSEDRQQLITEIDNNLPDNTSGQITAAVMRTTLTDIVDNSVLPEDIVAGANITVDVSNLPAITISSTGGGGGATSLDELSDVSVNDATTQTNYVLKYNGSVWVAAPEGQPLTFACSLTDGQSSPQLVGSGLWKGVGNITFGATYTNDTPSSAYITGTGWSNNLILSSPFTSGSNPYSMDFPSAGSIYTFELFASAPSGNANSTKTVAFDNYIYYGISNKSSGFVASDITGLTTILSNNKGQTFTVNATSGKFIIYSLPVRLGTVVFIVGGFQGGFNNPETISVTNSAGYTEDYYVYSSGNSGLGLTTVTAE